MASDPDGEILRLIAAGASAVDVARLAASGERPLSESQIRRTLGRLGVRGSRRTSTRVGDWLAVIGTAQSVAVLDVYSGFALSLRPYPEQPDHLRLADALGHALLGTASRRSPRPRTVSLWPAIVPPGVEQLGMTEVALSRQAHALRRLLELHLEAAPLDLTPTARLHWNALPSHPFWPQTRDESWADAKSPARPLDPALVSRVLGSPTPATARTTAIVFADGRRAAFTPTAAHPLGPVMVWRLLGASTGYVFAEQRPVGRCTMPPCP